MENRLWNSGREAVSESIGYLIIFGLILTGIGLITLYGYPLLIAQQSSANTRNMEETMIVLQNDMKSLTYQLANYKETSLMVNGGSLSLYGYTNTPQQFTISWTNTSPPPNVNSYTFTPGELRYYSTNDNMVITMENGAVIEKPLAINGSFMLATPRWYLDTSTDTLVINLMNLSTTPGTTQLLSESGVGTVRMRLSNIRMVMDTVNSGTSVNITYVAYNNLTIMPDGYSYAWQTYLTDPTNLGMSCFSNFPVLNCGLYNSVSNIIIKEYDVVVETI